MNFNIAICDDDEKDILKLTYILQSYYVATEIDLKIDTFGSGKDLLQSYKKPGDYHILLLDIKMPALNGIQIAEIVRTTVDKHGIIIFISNYPKYMQDSFRVHPSYYITKPITQEHISLSATLKPWQKVTPSALKRCYPLTLTGFRLMTMNCVSYSETC